jgi:xylulokinase
MAWTIGVDIGTYESKAALVDETGKLLASSARQHKVDFPKMGWAEHNPESVWWDGFVLCVQSLLEQEPRARVEVGAICVSGIGPCVLPVDKEFKPLRNAILYGVDTRATKQIDYLNERFGSEKINEITGNQLSSQATLPKILWIKENEPQVFGNTYKFVGCNTFINYRLTGNCYIDHFSAGSNHGCYDPATLDWCPELVTPFFNIDCLPDIKWSNEVVGHLNEDSAQLLGLKVGTVVACGSIDAASEALSVAVIGDKEMMLMYGSTHFMIQVTSNHVKHPRLWSGPYLFDGSWAIFAGMSTTGSLTRWIRDNLAQHLVRIEESGGESAYSALTDLASQSTLGANGLIMLPYFSGERTPINDPHAKGLIIGLTLSHNIGDIYRACLEGVGFGIRQHTELFRDIGAEPSSISAVGGGTKSKLWLQIVSDITGVAQKVYSNTLGASYGDAFLAAMALDPSLTSAGIHGWQKNFVSIDPDTNRSTIYNQLADLYLELYEQNKSAMHQLHSLNE